MIDVKYDSLSDSERRVGDYVRWHPDKVVVSSLQALAEKCSVSDATVLRFCRSLGFSGYQDFKVALVPGLLKRGTSIHREISREDDLSSARGKFIENLNKDIKNTFSLCDDELISRAANKIAEAGTIVIVGLAGSAGVARISSDCLMGLGIYNFYFSDRVEIERAVASLGKGDLIFGISHSGETQEVVYALQKGRDKGSHQLGAHPPDSHRFPCPLPLGDGG
ncbi:MAG: MurR/RpiR family transcriptional regulator, partial [bacterium]